MKKLIFIIPAFLFLPAQGGSSTGSGQQRIAQQSDISRKINRLNEEIKHNNNILLNSIKKTP